MSNFGGYGFLNLHYKAKWWFRYLSIIEPFVFLTNTMELAGVPILRKVMQMARKRSHLFII